MHSTSRWFAAAAAATLALTALSGSAFAAPPGTPPGQEKKEEATAPAPQPAAPEQSTTTADANGNAADAGTRGKSEQAHQKKEEKKATASNASGSSSHGINSTNAGVKPGNSTRKHTSCRTGGSMPTPSCTATTTGSVSTAATSDHSKRYGNGTTAAQIAVGRGAPGGTEIRGPGNSQPHKVCGKNGNWVDVHAVKTYVGLTACTSVQLGVTGRRGGSATVSSPFGAFASSPLASTSTTVGSSSAAGGAAGAVSTPEAGGVAGAFAEIGGVAGTLPFTGFPLWAVVLIALAVVAIGLSLWRRGRPASTRDVV